MESTAMHNIYDKIFKKILTLSSGSVIRLINGLFETDYPTDSTVTYNWTEFHDDRLRRTLADTILTIGGTDSYHLEAQSSVDDTIIFRVFEYSFGHANRMRMTSDGMFCLRFPEPKIIYLYYQNEVPDLYTLKLDFGSQGTFDYNVPALKFLEITAEELNRKNMVILIPFYLLKLRKSIETARTPENLEALKSLILNDIIGSISKNLEAGNITQNDAQKLRQLTLMLYRHLYAHYEEMEAVNDMTDESLILDIDIIEEKYETKIQKLHELEQQHVKREKQLDEEIRGLANENRKLGESIQGLIKENQQLRDIIEKLRRESD